jgi:hypothetical protein
MSSDSERVKKSLISPPYFAFAGHQAVAFDKPRPGGQGECAMTNAARTRVSESPPISALMTVIAILILPL